MARPPTDELRWRVRGVPWRPFRDIYPRLMSAPWTVTIGAAFAAYAGACFVFALLFAIEPTGVSGADSFGDLVWFSVQTLSTIGYGGMTPTTPWTNFLVTIESFIGLAGVAVVTAILYAKFSLPDARIRFSRTLAIHDRDGQPTLHLRMLNERTTPVLDVELQAGVLVEQVGGDQRFRRLRDVKLVRHRVPVFAMAFTLMHVLDDDSPLHIVLKEPERLRFLVVTMRGIDDRTLQPVFARVMFRHEHLAFGKGFADMVETGDDGLMDVHADRLDDLVDRPLSLEA